MIYFLDKDFNEIAATPSYVKIAFPNDILEESAKEVMYAQADGVELEYACMILDRPVGNKYCYTFVGDDAKAILLNWVHQ